MAKSSKTPPPFVISVSTLQVAHQAIGDIKARNATQAVALANSLLEIEAALTAAGQQPPEPASEVDDTPKQPVAKKSSRKRQ